MHNYPQKSLKRIKIFLEKYHYPFPVAPSPPANPTLLSPLRHTDTPALCLSLNTQ